MSAALPDPLVPADVDLRGYEFMPYYGDRLRDSDLNSRATDAEYRAAHNLWWASWKQVPASSLPDDDITLCKLADLGRDLKTWKQVRPRALHGFCLCSDGRLYHRVLSSIALESFEARVVASAKGKAGASKRWGKHRYPESIAQASDDDGTGNATATKKLSKRQDRIGQGQGHKTKSIAASPPDWLPDKAWADYIAMRKSIRKPLTDRAKELAVSELEKLRNQGHSPQAVLEQSIFHSWQGLFPLRVNGAGHNKQTTLEERNRQATQGWMPPEARDGAK